MATYNPLQFEFKSGGVYGLSLSVLRQARTLSPEAKAFAATMEKRLEILAKRREIVRQMLAAEQSLTHKKA